MDYFISNGKILNNNRELMAEEVYSLGTIPFENDDLYIVSKRPAKIDFEFHLNEQAKFSFRHKGHELLEVQIRALSENGYYVSNDKRIFCITNKVKELMVLALQPVRIPSLLSLLRSLSQNQLVSGVPDNLIEKLNEYTAAAKKDIKLFEKSLYSYQEEGVKWLTFCTENGLGTILADDMGLGKTAQVIALICETLQNEPSSNILIVVPNPLLDNWVREFQFFAPSIIPFIHYGKYRNGIADDIAQHSVILTPYTTMASDISMFEEINFRLVLFDEASMLKNPLSSRTTKAKRLKADVKIAMSGTPVENSLLDAWSLTDLVFPGYFGSLNTFKKEYVDSDIRETLESNLSLLEKSLRQIMIRRMKKDVLSQLPSRRDIYMPITAGVHERKEYDAIIEQMKNDLEGGGGGILPLLNRLQQFSAHPALIDQSINTDVNSLISASAKFEVLFIKLSKIALQKEKVIIFVTFRHAIDLIFSAIKEKFGINAGIIDGRTPNENRQMLIDDFSASLGFNVLILHPKTAGMGLNITSATNVIHYCRQWNPALEAQATARAWRNGQKEIVDVYYFYYSDTVEEVIDERIKLKQELSERVVSISDNKETDKKIMIEYLENL